ncbi:MAG: crossover junction endodeoxyribonuclease RuvC [Actinomycetales bacterium]
MRVLGVDPGLTRCGLGVVESRPGRRARLVHVEVVRTPAGDDLAARLLTLAGEIERVVTAHAPDVVAVERVFSQANVTSVMGTAQASGVAVLVGARAGLPVVLHTPTEVKAAVTGSGRAPKAQVTAMVTRILGLSESPRPADAADALALGICQLWRGPGLAVPVGPAGGTSGPLTPAQRTWLEAERRARRA